MARKARQAAIAFSTFACCFALFWLFTSQSSVAELGLSAACSMACAVFGVMLSRSAPAVRFCWRDVLQAWRIPFYIVQRVTQITWLLVQDLSGRRLHSYFRHVPFRTQRHDPYDTGRRVLATAYTTAAPNFIVLEISQREHRLYFHQLTRTGISDMLQALGARE